MDNLIIKECKINQIAKIKQLQPEGWTDIGPHFLFFCETPFCHPVAAFLDDEIVGVANGIINGKSAWLSHIIVSPEYRSRGIGGQLTQYMIDFLEHKNCKTLLLIATELGEPLYLKLGFKIVTYYWFFSGPLLNVEDISLNLRPLKPSDYHAVFEMDCRISGETRKHMLEKYLSNAWVFCQEETHEVSGYFLPDLGEGLIIAEQVQAGIELLKLKHSVKQCKTVLPQENEEGIKFLGHHGFEKFSSVSRMIRGQDISWKPNLIFSRTGGYYG